MRDLPPGWATDLAVNELMGSTVEDRGDHLVVRTPANPRFHWGHCLFVLDDAQVDEPAHWLGVFAQTFPDADWVALGLPRLPADLTPWTALGLEVELDDVLTTHELPRLLPAPQGYDVRRLVTDEDWEQHVTHELRENALTGEHPPQGHERFVRAQTAARRVACDRGDAAWFAAFHEGTLVADLGIVRCGDDARYQSVGTRPEHRRRGLAGHLLGVAARWAADRGARRWVIVTEATNPAGRVYRSVGFAPDRGSAQAYRKPGG
jgi:GNAT superfamily N-acetyltransferase